MAAVPVSSQADVGAGALVALGTEGALELSLGEANEAIAYVLSL